MTVSSIHFAVTQTGRSCKGTGHTAQPLDINTAISMRKRGS